MFPIIKIGIFWGLYWGPSTSGNCHSLDSGMFRGMQEKRQLNDLSFYLVCVKRANTAFGFCGSDLDEHSSPI